MADTLADLTPAQGRALTALLESTSIREAATAAGVHESAIRKWLREPGFRAAYGEARREAVGQAIAVLQRHASAASVTLVGMMTDPECREQTRYSAAKTVLEFALQGVALDDLGARLEALEAAAREPGQP